MPNPLTPKKVLTLGFYRAYTAPTEEMAAAEVAICDDLALGMSEAEVAQCKRNASRRVRRALVNARALLCLEILLARTRVE